MAKYWRTIWVIGASTGIGAALVEKLAKMASDASRNIIASARSKDRLEELAAGRKNIHAIALDVTDHATIDEALAAIEAHFGLPNLVILAAAIYSPMAVDRFSADMVEEHMRVNYLGVTNCLAPLLAKMRMRGSGEIAVIASLAGYRGLPGTAAYGPSKAALINLCEALHAELAGSGVTVRLINPGFVKTRLTEKNNFRMPHIKTTEEAADYIYNDLIKNDAFEIAFPFPLVWRLKLARILPYKIYFRVLHKLNRTISGINNDDGL
ncbi:MAG: SDR family NAD(P)-dependent oxidoreductase [Hyphomicrobiales bacterium]